MYHIRGGIPPQTTFHPFHNNQTSNWNFQQLLVPPRPIQCTRTGPKPNPGTWAHVPTNERQNHDIRDLILQKRNK